MLLTVIVGLAMLALTVALSYKANRVFWSSKHGQTNTNSRHGLPFGGTFVIYGPAFIGAALTAFAGSAVMSDKHLALACFASLLAGIISAIVGVCHSPQPETKTK